MSNEWSHARASQEPETLSLQIRQYMLKATQLILCERPSAGSGRVIRDIIDMSATRLLIVVDDPLSLLESANPTEVICEADPRLRRSHLVASAARTLQSQLVSELAEIQADEQLELRFAELHEKLKAHENGKATHLELARSKASQSAAWLQHLERVQQQQQISGDIQQLRAELAQPVGFLQRLLTRGDQQEKQKKLALLEGARKDLDDQADQPSDPFEVLVESELETVRLDHELEHRRLLTELEAQQKPRYDKEDRNKRHAALQARTDTLSAAAEEWVRANRRILIAKPEDLTGLETSHDFDKWIMDVAQATPELIERCQSRAPSGVMFGQVPTLHPPGYRNGTLSAEPTVFETMWNDQCSDGWAIELARIVARPVVLTNAQRAELKREPLISDESHEVRYCGHGLESVIAEIAFAPDISIACATQVLIDKVELPCLTTLGPATWTESESEIMALWMAEDKESRLAVDGVELVLNGIILASARFDRSRFINKSAAEEWLGSYILSTSPTCIRTRVS